MQSFQWKDVFAAPGTYRYQVVPMMGPDVDALTPHTSIALESNPVTIGGDWGDLSEKDTWQNKYFNSRPDASRDGFFSFGV